MSGGTGEDVILVPPDRRSSFLDESQAEHIRVQGGDGQTWERPLSYDLEVLLCYLTEHSTKKFWSPCTGTRCGYDNLGVYIHESHLKRYFGIVREGASFFLKAEMPEAVAKTHRKGGGVGSSDRMLGNLLGGIGDISKDVREDVLRAAFRGVDKDGNGVLGKDEMVALIRRVMPTMSGRQVVDMMKQADKNNDSVVNYNEFVDWLTRSAPKQVLSMLESEMESEYDCVRAVFRLWDKNGDGIITKKELGQVLSKTCPDMTPSQASTLCLHLDKNKDGQIDYDEFLEFVFGK